MAPISPPPPSAAPPRWLWLLALAPAAVLVVQIALFLRNIVFWDEFDTMLQFLTTLNTQRDAVRWLEELFALNNGHRMVTSRFLTAALWLVSGGIDFRLLGWIGNVWFFALFAVLVTAAPAGWPRTRLAVVLGLVLFHLEHFENLFWAGSSLDHFLVPMLAAIALRTLTPPSDRAAGPGRLLAAGALALAATLTLAHGLLLWPVGLVALLARRQSRAAFVWAAAGALVIGLYFHGFARAGEDFSILVAVPYALALLGAPVAFGSVPLAVVAGIALLGGLGRLGWTQRHTRPVGFFAIYALWLLASLALVALARSGFDGEPPLSSRYRVLACLLWGLALAGGWQRWAQRAPAGESRRLRWVLPVLVVFNVAANTTHWTAGASWAKAKEQSVQHYLATRQLDGTPFPLYNQPGRGERILRTAAAQGIYQFPVRTRLVATPDATPITPTGEIVYFIDRVRSDAEYVQIEGWAARPDIDMRRARVRVQLLSPDGTRLLYDVRRARREDVAAAMRNDNFLGSGFAFNLPRAQLPSGRFQVGFIIRHAGRRESIMTDTWIGEATGS